MHHLKMLRSVLQTASENLKLNYSIQPTQNEFLYYVLNRDYMVYIDIYRV